jgi:TM2 domain-containing membrane protein YozV
MAVIPSDAAPAAGVAAQAAPPAGTPALPVDSSASAPDASTVDASVAQDSVVAQAVVDVPQAQAQAAALSQLQASALSQLQAVGQVAAAAAKQGAEVKDPLTNMAQRQDRMETLEAAEKETLLKEQTALEALVAEQSSLAQKEQQLEAQQKLIKAHMDELAAPGAGSLAQNFAAEFQRLTTVASPNTSAAAPVTLLQGPAKVGDSANKSSKAIVPGAEFQTRNKITLALINGLGVGWIGFDRMYMGQLGIGLLKLVTLGGCGMWAVADSAVIIYHMLDKSETINTLGFQARFGSKEMEGAFWITLVAVTVQLMIISVAIATPVVRRKSSDPNGSPFLGEELSNSADGFNGPGPGKLDA